MKHRHYLLLRGSIYALLVVVLLIVIAFNKPDTFGIIFGIVFLSFFSYKSYSFFRQVKVAREEDRVYAPPVDASVTDKLTFYKRGILIGAIAFIILSVWTVLDLNSLESGTVESVSLWGPISFLYGLGGYWLAVLTTPVIGILVIISFVRKIQELKNVKDV